MAGREVREALDVQRTEDDEMIYNAQSQSANPRSQRGQALRGVGQRGSNQGVNIRQNRLTVQFNAMKLSTSIPGEGATPADGQYMQDDSGASMHMVVPSASRLYPHTAPIYDQHNPMLSVCGVVFIHLVI